MAGENGIWLVYRKTTHEERGAETRLMGRFAVHGGNITILEDHDGIIESMFPAGPLTSRELRRMQSMENGQSAYWDLAREDDLNEGRRADLVPELDLGAEPWPAEQE